MRPIAFTCEETISTTPADIVRQILDPACWPDFTGYGVIPGIRAAQVEVQTPGIVGTRFRVTNTDGSSHVEEIIEWQPDRRLRIRMQDFSAPLSRLATHFEETWEFQSVGDKTRVTRLFQMHAKSALTRPFLWAISLFLKRALARHLRQMSAASGLQRA
jgi:Polyketide cyclase / dehydrase and lipid transport